MSGAARSRAWRYLLFAFPRDFRRRHGDDLVELAGDLAAGGRSRAALALELLTQGLAARMDPRRPRRNSPRLPESRSSFMDRLLQDMRYGIRSLVNNPGVTLVVTLTLGLGIGANTAIFAVVNAVLLQPLPFDDGGRVFQVYEANLQRGTDRSNVSYPNLQDLIEGSELIETGGALTFASVNLAAAEYPERARASLVSGDLFRILGMQTLTGRAFERSDQDAGAEPVVVVTEGFWQQRLGADPEVVGTRLRVNGTPRTLVGVVSELPLADVDLLVPLRLDEVAASRTNHFLQGLVQVAPGVTAEQIQASAAGISEGLLAEYPESYSGWSFRLVELRSALVDDGWIVLVFLLGIVTAVLLIACANVTNVMLARAAARSREIAVRSAIGAGRGRIVRQLLTESLLLASCGGLAGLVFGHVGLRILVPMLPDDIHASARIEIDPVVFGFTFGVALTTGIVFGLAPALRASRARLGETLSETGAQLSGPASGRLRNGLVIAEVAAAVALLMVAGLFLRSLVDVTTRDHGFEAEGVLTMRLNPPARDYPGEELDRLADSLQAEIARVAGVESVAVTSQTPLASSRTYRGFKIDGQPNPAIEDAEFANWVSVTPGYFETLRMNLAEGRFFDARDDAAAEPAIVLNQSMARALFGQQSAVGRSVHIFTDEERARKVVGVVGDLVDRPFSERIDPQFFTPLAQAGNYRLALVVRTGSEADAVLGAVREVLRRIDPDLPVYGLQSMRQVMAGSVAGPRLLTTIVGSFAALALGLSALGLYGVIAYTVTRRTRELGVRMALGADATRVRRMVVVDAFRMAALATPVGLALGLVALQLIRTQLRRIQLFDPLTASVVVAMTVVAVLAASYVPARRATRVDPLAALRAE